MNRPIESLEPRRLLADVTLDIDRDASPLSATASLNGSSLTPAGGASGFLDGTVEVSSTKRGVKFLGGDVDVSDVQGNAVSFSFATSVPGQSVSVSGTSLVFTSTRIAVPENKFSTRRITATFDDGDVNVTGFPAVGTLNNLSGTVEYAIGRVKRSDSSLKLTVPFDLDVQVQYTVASVPQTLDVTVTGTLVAVGLFASPQALATATPTAAAKVSRVKDDVLG